MRVERNNDRENDNEKVLVVSFDLQNVIALPRANVSCFFYKRKLNLYNMTAHVAKYKHVYCGIWTEVQSGRSGNDIASAIFKVLCEILKNHTDITDLITWSDSCVPQNRNQMMSLAMLNILNLFPHLSSVTMKFSTPGHSCIQEVDNVHSHIEKVMAVSEFWSPVSFLRLLLRVNRKTPYNVVQLKNQHFKDFHKSSSL